jgi:hypothetical protein
MDLNQSLDPVAGCCEISAEPLSSMLGREEFLCRIVSSLERSSMNGISLLSKRINGEVRYIYRKTPMSSPEDKSQLRPNPHYLCSLNF